MRIVRFWNPARRQAALGVVKGNDVVDLSGLLGADEASFESLLNQAARQGADPASLVESFDAREAPRLPYELLDVPPDPARPYLLQPVVPQEVWAAGVTYIRSRRARQAESVVGDIYERVYDAPRPELFFKATPSRCVGPNVAVGARGDSRWTVPEPELALVLDAALNIVGYTLGNDMSARDIEGENPLYLPQAKVYSACCSLGPAVLLAAPEPRPEFLIACRILRQEREIFRGQTSTKQMHRSFADLVRYLARYNTLPSLTVLLTGTGIVPPDDVSLQPGDIIEMASPEIGTLRNPVQGVA